MRRHGAGDDGEAALDSPRGRQVAPGKTSMAERVYRRAAKAPSVDPEAAVASTAGSTGAPLPADARGRFESSLGTDLSAVRVHTGAESAAAAEGLGARAFAVGQDIHF